MTSDKKKDTYLARLGAAQESNPTSFFLTVVGVIMTIIFVFYCNWRAIGLATGATGPIVKHGLGYTFLQPFYSLWSIYFVFLGSRS